MGAAAVTESSSRHKKTKKKHFRLSVWFVDLLTVWTAFSNVFKWVVLISIIGFLTDGSADRTHRPNSVSFDTLVPFPHLYLFYYVTCSAVLCFPIIGHAKMTSRYSIEQFSFQIQKVIILVSYWMCLCVFLVYTCLLLGGQRLESRPIIRVQTFRESCVRYLINDMYIDDNIVDWYLDIRMRNQMKFQIPPTKKKKI
jgi:hypothetical protein